jgi:hypothetical protein
VEKGIKTFGTLRTFFEFQRQRPLTAEFAENFRRDRRDEFLEVPVGTRAEEMGRLGPSAAKPAFFDGIWRSGLKPRPFKATFISGFQSLQSFQNRPLAAGFKPACLSSFETNLYQPRVRRSFTSMDPQGMAGKVVTLTELVCKILQPASVGNISNRAVKIRKMGSHSCCLLARAGITYSHFGPDLGPLGESWNGQHLLLKKSA